MPNQEAEQKIEPTEAFREQVRKVWGNPKQVADAAFAELFQHEEDINLDHDDQISYAKQIGVLAGMMKDGNLDEFITAFTEQVLNG